MALSALISILPALLCSAPAQSPAFALLEEVTAEPRTAGTGGYDRALAIIERELRSAGRDVRRASTTVMTAVPTRSDVLLFEDAIAKSAFAGLRETWNRDAVPTAPLPPAYGWNPEYADTRGPMVDVGAGAAADYERLTGMRVPLRGAVALVRLQRSPAARTTTVRELAERAREAGCVALLVAPQAPGPTVDDFVLEDTRSGEEPLALPTTPIRTIEADQIRARLRVKRVRGADGKTQTVRVGPGPVEVGVVIECPVAMEKTEELTCDLRPAVNDQAPTHVVHVAVDPRDDQALGGAATLVAAVLACTESGTITADGTGAADSSGARIVFGPRHAESAESANTRLAGTLAPTSAAFGPSRLAPQYGESVEGLAARLTDELLPRLDAAAAWIAYSIHSNRPSRATPPIEAAAPQPALESALRVLLAPLPGPH